MHCLWSLHNAGALQVYIGMYLISTYEHKYLGRQILLGYSDISNIFSDIHHIVYMTSADISA